ncbi:MAG: AMP-binding protein [Oligoflexia bacterium]|nr:AMP-binding protein [Oligoflexia bacterium]
MKLLINNNRVDWESSKSHYFFNPRHPESHNLKKLAKQLPCFKSHIYLFTSNYGKICLLSKQAFLESAQAVNKHLQVKEKDVWLIGLPLFHVAGLSILARQFCAGFSVIKSSNSWNPKSFKKELSEKKVSLCSLVPSQLYDLTAQKIRSPKSLRALIIGGDSLSPFLYRQARELGWPVLISYGLTETSSQIACSPLSSLNKQSYPKMGLLNHALVKNKPARVKSACLLTAYFDVEKKQLIPALDSKGFFKLPDRTLFKNRQLVFLGRREEEIKILGERVDFKKLSFLLEKLAQNLKKEVYLLAVPDRRRGKKLVLITNGFDFLKIFLLVKKFNQKVLPFEKIQAIYSVSRIKKSHLTKFRQKKALQQLAFDTEDEKS